MTRTENLGARRWALAGVALGVFCVQLDSFALNLALPRIGRDLAASAGDLQWTVSAYLLSVGTLMLGAGRMGDLLGRRRVLVLGLSLFGAASLLCALATSLPALVAARVVQGVGGAVTMPVGLALLTTVFPAERRGRAIGAALGGGGVATVVGPSVGGVLAEASSWRALFLITALISALAVVAVRRGPDSRDPSASGVDVLGLVSVTAALAVLSVLVDRGPVWGWTSATTTGALVLFLALLALFVRHERRTRNPLLDLALLRNGPYVGLTAAGAVANAATVVFLFAVPLSLQSRWDLSSAASGLAFLGPAALMALAGPAAGRIPPGRAVPTMATCLACAGFSLGSASLADELPSYLLAITASGAALGLANALTLVATQSVVRPERAGEASGLTKTAITLAGGLGVMLSTSAGTPASGTDGDPLPTAGVLCLTSALLLALWSSLRLRPTRRGGGAGGVGRGT
ncbi:Major Facilitator Superfamily protein [Streptoalloteichus tenebrarius]|uniref:Major Facilitator Superfamily protein n=1 Tax=Streptoalloteichus tenebrarius (strain ATCC 17920 / DSM 40477 / JCM 4838 / CBS 697.72 / NBRC 16177 / NCIMB 11028 / NRRL B-12390 / A12253. 1 / ISP 5477) TaxID=1933 RepID=A0ABT1HYW6_STRSD|nr:Major Facilitator Superfamily protein [Streptoalloteichus tenebrarius]